MTRQRFFEKRLAKIEPVSFYTSSVERVRHLRRNSMAQGPQWRRRSRTIRQRSAKCLMEQYRSQIAETGTRLHHLREALHELLAISSRDVSQRRALHRASIGNRVERIGAIDPQASDSIWRVGQDIRRKLVRRTETGDEFLSAQVRTLTMRILPQWKKPAV